MSPAVADIRQCLVVVRRRWPLVLMACLFAGCGALPEQDGPPRQPVSAESIPDAVPRVEPPSRYGNPESYVVNGQRYYTRNNSKGFTQRGIASWYGRKFHGRRTSSGEVYDMYAMTAAHKSLPLPSYVQVTNLENGRQAVVRVNDRGPFHAKRVIDLSYVAALKLDIADKGVAMVELRSLDPRNGHAGSPGKSSPSATGDSPGIYVQVGAFVLRANAERMKAKIEALADAAVRITQAVSEGRPIYRVRLGPMLGVEHLERVAERLVAKGLTQHNVIIE